MSFWGPDIFYFYVGRVVISLAAATGLWALSQLVARQVKHQLRVREARRRMAMLMVMGEPRAGDPYEDGGYTLICEHDFSHEKYKKDHLCDGCCKFTLPKINLGAGG